MEFGSLRGVLDEHSGCKPLKDFALLKACLEIAQGMEYLVSNAPAGLGYVHRKLSAGAVLVDATFTMKISDFSGMVRREPCGGKANRDHLTGEPMGYEDYLHVPKVRDKYFTHYSSFCSLLKSLSLSLSLSLSFSFFLSWRASVLALSLSHTHTHTADSHTHTLASPIDVAQETQLDVCR